MTYSSDLTDAEWAIFEPLLLEILPPKKQTRPCNWTKREVFNGILYQLKNGCNDGISLLWLIQKKRRYRLPIFSRLLRTIAVLD